ncbi:hypothetical protein HPB51_000398 [Rhipicephalus microplus]|uniref:Uncharacterized protein n=1 Tax=Rhipicephalus microplus TaxID=6941 RepID=A0A9J6DRD0_RHIMP|nr:hypothetical protein HPB51_000398 [Rhipicephalus microplus]
MTVNYIVLCFYSGEDVHANDGTYTGQFTKFRGSGRYMVVIEVTNKSQTEFLDWAPNNVPAESSSTAAVSSIDLRTSRSIQTMLDLFHKATEISEQDLLSGSMKPLPAFSQQLATISIPSTIILGQSQNETTAQAHSASGYNVYFALVTTNNYGSRSEVSNLASVNVPAHFTVSEGIGCDDFSEKEQILVRLEALSMLACVPTTAFPEKHELAAAVLVVSPSVT